MKKSIFKAVCFFVFVLAHCIFFISPVSAAVSYAYDANGNLTSDGKNCYTYNEANQVKQVKLCAGNVLVAEYLYDYQGNRIVKKEYTNSVLSKTTYTPDKSIETKKLADNSVQNTSYYYVNNELLARKNPDNSKVFYHNDHLGSASLLTDQNGNILEETTYYPYGEIRSGGTQSKYLYTGKEKDTESGLNYYGARYYDAHTRQFTQPDTILPDPYDPQQLNRYAYTRGNPLKYTDPSGNYIETVFDVAFIGMDIHDIRSDPSNPWNYAALGADTVSTALPGVAGLGRGVKLLEHSGKVDNVVGAVAKNSGKIADAVSGSKKNATGVIYWAFDEAKKAPTYIGKTIDFNRRAKEHLKIGRVIQPVVENLPVNTLAGVEQAAIEKFGLSNLENVRNAISPKNSVYKAATQIGKQILNATKGW